MAKGFNHRAECNCVVCNPTRRRRNPIFDSRDMTQILTQEGFLKWAEGVSLKVTDLKLQWRNAPDSQVFIDKINQQILNSRGRNPGAAWHENRERGYKNQMIGLPLGHLKSVYEGGRDESHYSARLARNENMPNPGEQRHRDAAAQNKRASVNFKLSQSSRIAAQNRWPIEERWANESRLRGLPNPTRTSSRTRAKLTPLLLLGAVGLGLWWLSKRK